MQTKNRPFAVRILQCIRNEIGEKRQLIEMLDNKTGLLCVLCGISPRAQRSKALTGEHAKDSQRSQRKSDVSFHGKCRRLLRRQRVHLVEDAYCFQHHAPHNLQALGTELVCGVLCGVPEDIVITVIEVDQIGAWHSAF